VGESANALNYDELSSVYLRLRYVYTGFLKLCQRTAMELVAVIFKPTK